MYECQCGFKSLNKKAFDMHKCDKKDKENQDKDTPRLANMPVSNVVIGLITEKTLCGRIEQVTKYEIVLKSKDGSTFIVMKGNVEYVELLGDRIA